MSKIIDISLPIHNGMWSYRDEWCNKLDTVSSTKNGDPSTVYNFNIYSHTGTYIETSQHKFDNNILLTDFAIETFHAKCKVVCLKNHTKNIITFAEVKEEMAAYGMTLNQGDNIIVSAGWGGMHNNSEYILSSPSFEPQLMEWITKNKVSILGVDTPSLENINEPYQPVNNFFKENPNSLLLAPLKINHNYVSTGEYTLSCLPALLSEVSGSITRAFLIEIK